jgi:NADPH-dependent glutamate synthase beta subunit-like oxidoreductase
MSAAAMQNRLFIPRSYLTTEGNKTGSWCFLRPRYEDKTAPCAAGCPAGEDIPKIEMLTAQGFFKEAWETILQENPFPAVCGRVCFHPCEGSCNRGEYDDSVAVHTLERFLSDTAARYDLRPSFTRLPSRKERISVVGAGPAGLTAAWFLTLLGYSCDVFEASPEAGGVLRWGIPAYRLPADVLRQDLRRLEKEGIRIFTRRPMDRHFFAEAAGQYQAVILACGYGRGQSLSIPGEMEVGVVEGLDFLRMIRASEMAAGGGTEAVIVNGTGRGRSMDTLGEGKAAAEGSEFPERIGKGALSSCEGQTAVIGGGNTAVDVARSVIRLGGKAVIYYRRRRQDMPAFADEVRMALEEGVVLEELVSPAAIGRDGEKIVLSLRQMIVAGAEGSGRARVIPDGDKMKEVRVRRVIRATGAGPEESWMLPAVEGTNVMALSHCRLVPGEGKPIVVYAGDLANATKSVAHAIASGKEAAIALDALLREGSEAIIPRLQACAVGDGPALSMDVCFGGERRLRNHHIVVYTEINTDHFGFAPRLTQPRLLVEERVRSFAEIDLKISAGLAMKEAERCFNCGLCNGCDKCWLYCPDVAVIREGEVRRIDYDYCKGCGICVVECPRDAMFLGEGEGEG